MERKSIADNKNETEIGNADTKNEKMENPDEKYKLLTELMMYSHGLVSKKFDTMVIVNGILFAGFNLLNIQNEKSSFLLEKFVLSIIGFIFSIFWYINIRRSVKYTKYYKNEMDIISEKTSIKVLKKDMAEDVGKLSSGNIVLLGSIGQIVLWSFLLSFFLLSDGTEQAISFLFYSIIGLLFIILWKQNII